MVRARASRRLCRLALNIGKKHECFSSTRLPDYSLSPFAAKEIRRLQDELLSQRNTNEKRIADKEQQIKYLRAANIKTIIEKGKEINYLMNDKWKTIEILEKSMNQQLELSQENVLRLTILARRLHFELEASKGLLYVRHFIGTFGEWLTFNSRKELYEEDIMKYLTKDERAILNKTYDQRGTLWRFALKNKKLQVLRDNLAFCFPNDQADEEALIEEIVNEIKSLKIILSKETKPPRVVTNAIGGLDFDVPGKVTLLQIDILRLIIHVGLMQPMINVRRYSRNGLV